MKKIIYKTKRFYIEEDDHIVTTYFIGVKEYNRYIVEGDYSNLETAIEDIEFFEKTVKDIETLFESNPIYN